MSCRCSGLPPSALPYRVSPLWSQNQAATRTCGYFASLALKYKSRASCDARRPAPLFSKARLDHADGRRCGVAASAVEIASAAESNAHYVAWEPFRVTIAGLVAAQQTLPAALLPRHKTYRTCKTRPGIRLPSGFVGFEGFVPRSKPHNFLPGGGPHGSGTRHRQPAFPEDGLFIAYYSGRSSSMWPTANRHTHFRTQIRRLWSNSRNPKRLRFRG